ncbi:tripartite tricarboxylate transporter substrate binding protein [Rhizobium cremeum]|uniref:Bug family tripartite tricarboxylate transporter substrate binding protein n=1 Tax=Rhizobium cremeum TaxID=2813827 RepID=UPI000DD5372F|nr:tripartite tricarboxylate transporter substrate binding protein [Rhizobium cremeum]MCJ7995570.1 tripartite tricarboxylate transporter substrate binding protein [Rhizobium cremeum]MCJ8001068.1 tripartite tricarboxylate transporter substrate binding protein [Rhizobium cremeum]
MTKRTLLGLAFGLTIGFAAQLVSANAQEQVTIIVPFPPGGATDTTARFIEPKLSATLGQPVVIDNRPGATGAIGAGLVAQAAADGKTLLVASLGTFATNPFLQKNLSYDPLKDFDLLTVAVSTPNVLVTHPGFKATTVEELVATMKENPDTVSFANSGNGSSDHLTAALFFQATDTKGVHVSYKGGSAAQADLIGGHVDVSFQNLGAIINYVKEGQMKALAQTGETRHPLLPDVPTLTELGYKDIVVSAWQGVAAPKGLPAETKAKLNEGLKAALSDPDVIAKFNEIGFQVVGNSNEEFSAFLQEDMARWKNVIETGNITAE